MVKATVVLIGFWAAAAAVLFGAAGRTDVPMFWVYLALVVVPGLGLIPALRRHSPGLVEERIRPGPGEQDRLSKPAMLVCMLASFVIAGLDIGRGHWSVGFPASLQVAGLVSVAIGYAISAWALWHNPFFSSAVRLQPDRQQRVVASGPYRRVRHPGYAGGVLFALGTGLALGSWGALALSVVMALFILRRTALEDAMLQRGLSGYTEYATAVRFRLLPGIW